MLRHRVLVVDEPNISTWMAYLSHVDCDTKVAASVDVLGKMADWRPDLVVLDPLVCGFDFCRQIKQSVSTARIMVLMVSQLRELNDIEMAVAAGADDFLSKPVSKEEFLKRVENLLKQAT